MQKLESSQGTGYGLMIISIFISGSDTSALVSSSNVSYYYAITAAVLVDHSNKMENTTSRLAIRIQNYPPYEVDWADNSAQKARCDLEEKDILPNDEDGQQLYDHNYVEIRYVLLGQKARKLIRFMSVSSICC